VTTIVSSHNIPIQIERETHRSPALASSHAQIVPSFYITIWILADACGYSADPRIAWITNSQGASCHRAVLRYPPDPFKETKPGLHYKFSDRILLRCVAYGCVLSKNFTAHLHDFGSIYFLFPRRHILIHHEDLGFSSVVGLHSQHRKRS
jgi:hypothetical protein